MAIIVDGIIAYTKRFHRTPPPTDQFTQDKHFQRRRGAFRGKCRPACGEFRDGPLYPAALLIVDGKQDHRHYNRRNTNDWNYTAHNLGSALTITENAR